MNKITWEHEATIACVRAGGDLQVVVNVKKARSMIVGNEEGRRYVVYAFDSDGNPVLSLGAFLDQAPAFAMLPSLVQIAREARKAGHLGDFDMVKWTYIDDGTGQTQWAGGRDLNEDICNSIGT